MQQAKFLASQPNDFLSYDCSIRIEAPVQIVFDIVGDLSQSASWAGSGHIRSISKVTEGPVGTGTKYQSSEKITMPYHAETEIITYQPPEFIAWRSKPVGERVPFHRWAFRLEPDGSSTVLSHHLRAARAFGVMGLVQRLGFLFTRPKHLLPPGMEKTLQNVKAIAEGPSPSP